MPETLACLTKSGDGGKSRSSWSTDSIVAEAIWSIPLSLEVLSLPAPAPARQPERRAKKSPQEVDVLRAAPVVFLGGRVRRTTTSPGAGAFAPAPGVRKRLTQPPLSLVCCLLPFCTWEELSLAGSCFTLRSSAW